MVFNLSKMAMTLRCIVFVSVVCIFQQFQHSASHMTMIMSTEVHRLRTYDNTVVTVGKFPECNHLHLYCIDFYTGTRLLQLCL